MAKCETSVIRARTGQLSIYADCVPSLYDTNGNAIEWGREVVLSDVTNLAMSFETEGGDSECIGTGCKTVVAGTKTTPSIKFNHYGAGQLNYFTAYDSSNIAVSVDAGDETFTGSFTTDDMCLLAKCNQADPDVHVLEIDVVDFLNLSSFESNGCRKLYPRDIVVLKNGVAIDINTDFLPTVSSGNTAFEFYGLLSTDVITITFTYSNGIIETTIGQNVAQAFRDLFIREVRGAGQRWCNVYKMTCAKFLGIPAPIFANCGSTDIPEATEITAEGKEIKIISQQL